MPLPPTFLDEFKPQTQARWLTPQGPSVSIAAAGLMGGLSFLDPAARWGRTNVRRTHELVRHYAEWNYVSINAIAFKIAQQFPYVGRVVKGKPADKMRLSTRQRQHLGKFYGGMVQSAHEDIDPVADDHPFLQFCHYVNPVDWWGAFAFETMLFWELTGKFFWWIIWNNAGPDSPLGVPAEIWVIPSQWVIPDYDRKTGILNGWNIIPDGDWTRRLLLEPHEVLYYWNKSPLTKIDGYSATQAGARWIDNSESIEKSRWHSFKNGPNPEALIELDKETYGGQNPNDTIIERIKQKFKARMSGVQFHGDPIVAPPGVKVTPWSKSPKEMDYTGSAEQMRDNILALRKVPKPVAGITTDLNRATIEGANVVFAEHCINPRLAMLAGFIQRKLASLWDPSLRVWFDDCIPLDAEQEIAETQLDAQLGAISPDERRIDRGRPPRLEPAYETCYIQTTLSPMDEAMQPDQSEFEEPGDSGGKAGAEQEDDTADGGAGTSVDGDEGEE